MANDVTTLCSTEQSRYRKLIIVIELTTLRIRNIGKNAKKNKLPLCEFNSIIMGAVNVCLSVCSMPNLRTSLLVWIFFVSGFVQTINLLFWWISVKMVHFTKHLRKYWLWRNDICKIALSGSAKNCINDNFDH